VGQKQLEIHRSRIAFQGCRHYISNHAIPQSQHSLYAIASLVIFSSIFGKPGFDIVAASKYLNVSKNQIIRAIEALLEDEVFIVYVYYET